jgi:hypothetical protein
MSVKVYTSARALRTAIETRLLQLAERESMDIMRLRRQFTFDRFLCRIFYGGKDTLMLQGGYAIELRVAEVGRCHKKMSAPALLFRIVWLQRPGHGNFI